MEVKKFLDQEGLSYLWKKLSLQDYPNNDTLVAIINAIDENKLDKSTAIAMLENAVAGQVPVVKSVDENGKPLEWEAGDLPEGLPSTDAVNQYLTIDADGNRVWEEKTHYFVEETKNIVDETTGNGPYVQFFVNYGIKLGKEYTILYNGVEYKSIAISGFSGDICLGNLYLGKKTLEDTGEPYLFTGMQQGGLTTFAIFANTGTQTFSITGPADIGVPLDDRFIPSSIARIDALEGLATETYVNEQIAAIPTPDYPVDSVNGKTGTVVLSASDVGALPNTTVIPSIAGLATEIYVNEQIASIPTPDVSGQISTHNTSTTAHPDIRTLITNLTTRLNTLADSDDTTLDQLSEIVSYIKSNKSLIENITTNKINVSDIIDNLTTYNTSKPLSANQGAVLKDLIDVLEIKVNAIDYPVDSVNGKTGEVVLTAEDVGALPATTSLFDGRYESLTNKPLILGDQIGSMRTTSASAESDEYVLGRHAFAEGYLTQASNIATHAEGYESIASGDCAHAENSHTTASGPSAHAEGYYSVASGYTAHAEGYYTEASGDYSHAEGYETQASSQYQHVQGKFNITDTEEKYAHIVGNGSNISTRSNAHTIDWDGLGWFASGVKIGGTGQDDINAKTLATEDYVNNKITTLIDTAPDTLNTLNELASALGDDPNFATTVTTELDKKALKTDLDLLVKKAGDTMTGNLNINTNNYNITLGGSGSTGGLYAGYNNGTKYNIVYSNSSAPNNWIFNGTAELAKKLQNGDIIGEFENQTTLLGWRIAGPYSSTDTTTVALSLRVNKDTGVIQARVDSKAGTLYPKFYTTTNKPTASEINAVAKAGDTMTGNLIIEKTAVAATSVTVTNPNRKISLSVNSNSGLYDDTNSKWVLNSAQGSSNWTFYGTATGNLALTNIATGRSTTYSLSQGSQLFTITFGKTFSSTPKVYLTPYYNSGGTGHTNYTDVHKVWYEVVSINTTQFVINCTYNNTSSMNVLFDWLAISV